MIFSSGFVVTLNIASVQNIYSFQYNSTLPGMICLSGQQYIVKHNVSGNNTNNTETLNPCQVAHLNVGICQTYWISQVSLDTVKSSGSD